MGKKTGIFIFIMFSAVSILFLGLVSTSCSQAQESDGQQAVDKSMQFFHLQMAELLKMNRLSSSSPNLIGKWQGETPKLTATGDCDSDIVLVTIAKQCGSLMNGTVKVDDATAIPVVGAYYNNGRVVLSGSAYINSTYWSVTLIGKYSKSSSSVIKVQGFQYYSPVAYNNTMYNVFTLEKQ